MKVVKTPSNLSFLLTFFSPLSLFLSSSSSPPPLPSSFFNKLYLFRVVLGSQQNWAEYTEISYISPAGTYAQPSSHYQYLPREWHICVTIGEPTLAHCYQPMTFILGFTHGAIHSLVLDKYIMKCVYHYCITE